MKVISASCFHSYCFLSTLLVMMGLLKVATRDARPPFSRTLFNTSVVDPGEMVVGSFGPSLETVMSV